MAYLAELIARIQDRDRWPDVDRPHFLEELNAIADDAFATNTVHGYLASLLIYHQLTEEMLRLLLEYSEFFVQLRIAPSEIHFLIPENAMFGRLLDAAKSSIDFENKTELLTLAQSLNRDRIDLVHELTRQKTSDAIGVKVQRARQTFEDFYAKFLETQDWFMLCFKDLRKDNDWEDLLAEE